MVGRDVRTTTGSNLKYIETQTGVDTFVTKTWKVREILNKTISGVPPADGWRIPYLAGLLQERQKLSYNGSETGRVQELINSLSVN